MFGCIATTYVFLFLQLVDCGISFSVAGIQGRDIFGKLYWTVVNCTGLCCAVLCCAVPYSRNLRFGIRVCKGS